MKSKRLKREKFDVRCFRFILYALLFTLHTSLFTVFADFEDLGWGVASAGLSNSVMFSKKIPALISINPAASSFIKMPAVSLEYENLYPGLSDGSKLTRNILTYSQQLESAGFGGGVENFTLDGLYTERIFLVNYSQRLRNELFWGLNFRHLQKKYGSDDYTNNAIGSDGVAVKGKTDLLFGANGFKNSGYTFDVGVSKLVRDFWHLSGAVSCLTSPDVSLGGGDKRKPTFTMGASFEDRLVTVGSIFRFHDGDYTSGIGFERSLPDRPLKVRGGLSIGNSQVRLLSVGFGYVHSGRFLVDYAWTYPLVGLKETGGRHRVSLSIYLRKEEEKADKAAALSEVERYLEKAREAFAKEDWLTALSYGKKVLEFEPKNEEANEILSKSVSELRELSKPFVTEGFYFIEKGKFDIAGEKFDTALEINPEDDGIKQICLKIKKITMLIPQAAKKDKVSRLLRTAVKAYIEDDITLALNSAVYVSQIDFTGVGSKFLDLMKSEYPSQYQQIAIVAGMNLVEQKLYASLKNIYNARYDLAIMDCDDVLKLEPENVLAMTRLGSAYYALGNKAKAVNVWRKALEYEPNNKDILDFLGMSGGAVKDVYEKKKESEKASEKTVKDSYLRGIAAMKRGEIEKAASLFEKAVSMEVTDGASLDYQKKASAKLGECEKQLEKKSGQDLNMMKVYFGLGMSYYKNGEYGKAVDEFEKVLKIKPDHPQSKKMIDLCRQKMKK
ncbi:MAG: tetratricopeptide repeat protein [bacterium]